MSVRHLIASASLAFIAGLSATSAQAYSQLVVFGDSLSDDGNAYSALQTLSSTLKLPGSPYVDGRFTNGAVAAEVMAQSLGIGLDDRAYGGALTGTGNQFTSTAMFATVMANTGMASQVSGYITEKGGKVDASALYMVWGGGNDFLSVLASNDSALITAAATTAITNIVGEVKSLYAAGAREFFVPDLADFSFTIYGATADEATRLRLSAMTLRFNQAVQLYLGAFDQSLADASVHFFDTNAALTSLRSQIAADGGNLGSSCWTGSYLGAVASSGATLCSDPDTYFLFDKVHPTAIVHETLGNAFAASVSAVPEPGSMGLALVGLLGVAVVGRRRAA